jgi:hypothetical protein
MAVGVWKDSCLFCIKNAEFGCTNRVAISIEQNSYWVLRFSQWFIVSEYFLRSWCCLISSRHFQKIHHSVHFNPPLDFILRHKKPVHPFIHYFLKILFSIIPIILFVTRSFMAKMLRGKGDDIVVECHKLLDRQTNVHSQMYQITCIVNSAEKLRIKWNVTRRVQ